MSRLKSFISTRVRIDRATKSHNCRRNKSHRVDAGNPRLKVPRGRGDAHYCIACGIKIVESDIERLQDLRNRLLAAQEGRVPE